MAKTQIANVRVNDVELNWTDDSRRKPRACRGCKTPTTGRRDEIAGRSSAWCLTCAMADAFKRGAMTPAKLSNVLYGEKS